MDKKFLKVELQDGPGTTGGISFTGETLEDFLSEAGLSTDASMEEINKALVDCGILPILDHSCIPVAISYNYGLEKLVVKLFACRKDAMQYIMQSFKEEAKRALEGGFEINKVVIDEVQGFALLDVNGNVIDEDENIDDGIIKWQIGSNGK